MTNWLIRWPGGEFRSDDLLIEDIAAIEKASGTSWYIANPLREVAVGRAMLAAAMLRSGQPDADVESTLDALTFKHFKDAFTPLPDDDEAGGEAEEVDPSPPSLGSRSASSSPGESVTGGPPTSPEPSG